MTTTAPVKPKKSSSKKKTPKRKGYVKAGSVKIDLGPRTAPALPRGSEYPILELQPGEIMVGKNDRDENAREGQAIRELAASIGRWGLMQPVGVQELAKAEGDKRYRLVWGHRRYIAHELLSCEVIEAKVLPATMTDGEIETLRLIENEQRLQLTPAERSRAVLAMLHREMVNAGQIKARGAVPLILSDLVVKTVAAACCVSEAWVRQLRNVAALPVKILEGVSDGRVPMTWAVELSKVQDHEALGRWAQRHLVSTKWDAASLVVDDRRELSLDQVRLWVENELCRLDRVKWHLDQTVPQKGKADLPACQGCPHNTASDSWLFADDSGENKGSSCRNPSCFEAKQLAVELTTSAAAKGAGRKAAVKRGEYSPAAIADELIEKLGATWVKRDLVMREIRKANPTTKDQAKVKAKAATKKAAARTGPSGAAPKKSDDPRERWETEMEDWANSAEPIVFSAIATSPTLSATMACCIIADACPDYDDPHHNDPDPLYAKKASKASEAWAAMVRAAAHRKTGIIAQTPLDTASSALCQHWKSPKSYYDIELATGAIAELAEALGFKALKLDPPPAYPEDLLKKKTGAKTTSSE